MKIAILQSSYIPWKGYFDLIASADKFVIYDDMQFTKRDWRNRNLIKTPQGLRWLTIPVKVKGKFTQRIKDTETASDEWRSGHWKSLEHNYRNAPYFDEIADWVKPLYLDRGETNLSSINRSFLESISNHLNIRTPLLDSDQFELPPGKTKRLVSICSSLGATTYLTGPAALSYLDKTLFAKEGIDIEVMDYSGYPLYRQQWDDFSHKVSVLDLLFNEGPNASHYMKFPL